jgi:hypothetical protein
MPAHYDHKISAAFVHELMIPDVLVHCIANTIPNSVHTSVELWLSLFLNLTLSRF